MIKPVTVMATSVSVSVSGVTEGLFEARGASDTDGRRQAFADMSAPQPKRMSAE